MTIMCSVNNCHYWSQGNVCVANKILVTSDAVGSSADDTYDAPQASNAAPTPVNSCMETCCKTFAEKNKQNQFGVDGVYKKS